MFLSLKAGAKKSPSASLRAEVVVCPPFVYLTEAVKSLKGSRIKFGAQDCSLVEGGAHTGEVSGAMLKSIGVKFIILGHSERRALGETNEMITGKIKIALKNNLTPIVCLGETLEQRKDKKTFAILEGQLKETIGWLGSTQIKRVIIVYEPTWAISANKVQACPVDEALTVILFLRKLLARMAGIKAISAIPILYGGSVNNQNIKDYLQLDAISGLLVGAASLDIKGFLKIIDSGV